MAIAARPQRCAHARWLGRGIARCSAHESAEQGGRTCASSAMVINECERRRGGEVRKGLSGWWW